MDTRLQHVNPNDREHDHYFYHRRRHLNTSRRPTNSSDSHSSVDANRNRIESRSHQTSSGDHLTRRYHVRSAASNIREPSYERIGRRRYLMESRGALYFPPVTTMIGIMLLFLYYYREKLNVLSEEDVYVSATKIWRDREIWRLFVAQFFHFGRLQVIVNTFTLYAHGRYLEKKIKSVALFVVIILMSVVTHCLYMMLNPLFCNTPNSSHVLGFGNVIYSLRVLLAYAMEPRNYARDFVFGMYPMVLSTNMAPWQPILDLFVFWIVVPEQCITGQLSGIIAGFIVTYALLLWPTGGIYVVQPPSWASDEGPGGDANETAVRHWRMSAYPGQFWLPSPIDSDASFNRSRNSSQMDFNQDNSHEFTRTNVSMYESYPLPASSSNGLHQKSVELKSKIHRIYSNSKIPTITSFKETITKCRKSRPANDDNFKVKTSCRNRQSFQHKAQVMKVHRQKSRRRRTENKAMFSKIGPNDKVSLEILNRVHASINEMHKTLEQT